MTLRHPAGTGGAGEPMPDESETRLDRVSHVTLVVRDQEKAKEWYVRMLGFEVRADETFAIGEPEEEGEAPPTGRWLTVAPPGQEELEVILEPLEWGLAGDDPEEKEAVVGHNGFVIETDDCRAAVEELESRGVKVVGEVVELPWGVSAVIEDLYGNRHNVLEPTPVEPMEHM